MISEKVQDHLRTFNLEFPEEYEPANPSDMSLLPNILQEELTTAEILQESRQSAEAVLRDAGVEDDWTKEPLDRDDVSPATREYWALLVLKRARHLQLTSEIFAGLAISTEELRELALGTTWIEWQEALVRSAFLLGRTAGLLEEHTYVPDGDSRPLVEIGLEGHRLWASSSGGGSSPRALTVRWRAIMHEVVAVGVENDPSIRSKVLAKHVESRLQAARPPAIVAYSTILKEIRKLRYRQRIPTRSHETRRGTKKDGKPSEFAR